MKRVYKIAAWAGGSIVLIAACLAGYVIVRKIKDDGFPKTKIYPDEKMTAPPDTVITVNGIPIKMIGIAGGKIDCKGLQHTIELDSYYMAETEVTQELWKSVMGYNNSINVGDSLPVENVDLVECLTFAHKLDSISGHHFEVPSHPEWLYAFHLSKQLEEEGEFVNTAWYNANSGSKTHAVKQKKGNSLGLYDMLGNVAEWTVSGSDPLFIVAGGSHADDSDKMTGEIHEYDFYSVTMETIGMRLASHPEKNK